MTNTMEYHNGMSKVDKKSEHPGSLHSSVEHTKEKRQT